MARTYPLTIEYNDSLRSKVNPLSFASLWLVDLHKGHSQYLSTMGQLTDALPKTLEPASHFELRDNVTRPGQSHLRHSMRATMWFLLPSDGVFCHSSSLLQYYLTRQTRCVVLRGGDMTRPPLECCLNWVPDPALTPARDHGKENHPPAAKPRKLPRKVRPQRKRKEHHQHPATFGSTPGTSQPPRCSMSTREKHPQLLQHPQPPRSAANQNSSWPNPLDQAELGQLYKPTHSSLRKDSTTKSRQDYLSGSNLSFSSKRSHRDYFSESPSGLLKQKSVCD